MYGCLVSLKSLVQGNSGTDGNNVNKSHKISRGSRFNNSGVSSTDEEENDHIVSTQQKTPFDLLHLSLGLGLSFAIVALSKAVATALGIGSYAVLFITAITVVLATLAPKGHNERGRLRVADVLHGLCHNVRAHSDEYAHRCS